MKLLWFLVYFGVITATLITIPGCSSKATSTNIPFLNNIPDSQTTQVDDTLSKVNFKFQEPTSLPFDVSYAKADLNEAFNSVQHVQLMFITNDKRSIVMTVDKGTTFLDHVVVMKRQVTKLSDGTEAVYGNNDASSQLIWAKDGITYSLVSSKDDNGKGVTDLSMNDLIKVADSFK